MSSSSNYPPPAGAAKSSTQRELDRLGREKANKEATKIQLESMKEDIDETKSIAISARNKSMSHTCVQEERMSSWDKWFKGIMITVVGAVVVVGSFMAVVFYTKADASDVEAVKMDVTAIKSDVSDIQLSQERIEEALDPKSQLELEAQRLALIKQAMKEAVREVKLDIRPDRLRGVN